MTNYTLKPNESVLYNGNVRLEKRNGQVDFTLTNLNLVFVTSVKKLFSKEQIDIETYPVSEIKFYNNVPQIKQKDSRVEIYLTNNELVVLFTSMIEARKFVSSALHLLTGKTFSERSADRVKGAVNLIDETLGINTVNTIKNTLENGIMGTVVGSIGKKAPQVLKKGTSFKETVGFAKDLLSNKSTNEDLTSNENSTSSLDNQVAALKKLKELVDAGILTQEEFELKKKQLLNL